MLGIKNTNLDPTLIKILPSGIAVYLSPFKDVFGSRVIFGGPHKSFTKEDDGLKTKMSNAVFLIREQIYEGLNEEYEDRCFSITTNKKLGLTVNPYPINEEDIWDCDGVVPDQFEDYVDDHEKLLELLEETYNKCKVHCANVTLEKFKVLIQDEHKLHYEEKLWFLTMDLNNPKCMIPNALINPGVPEWSDEKTTVWNQEQEVDDPESEISRIVIFHDEKLSDFTKEEAVPESNNLNALVEKTCAVSK